MRIVLEDLTQEGLDRYSIQADDRVEMWGLLGAVVFADVDPDVVALWRVAEHIHAGRNARFRFARSGWSASTPEPGRRVAADPLEEVLGGGAELTGQATARRCRWGRCRGR